MIQKLFRKVDNVNALQLFQLFRYSSLVLLGIFFAKIGVPKSSIAQLESLIFTSGLVSFFWVNGFVQLLLSEYNKLNKSEKKKATFRYFLTFQLFSVVAAIAVLIFFPSNQSTTIAIFVLFNTPSLLNEYILYLNQQRKALLTYAITTFTLLVGLTVGIVVLLVLAFDKPLHNIIGVVLIVFAFVAFLRWLFALFLVFRFSLFDISIVKNMQWPTAFMLIIGFLLSGSSEYISGWFVKHYFDAAAFTTFRYGTKELPLFTILAATLSNAMIAVIAQQEKDGILLLKQRSLKQMHIFFPIAILLSLSAPFLFKLLFTNAFFESGKLFSLTMLLTIPRLVFPQPILHAKGEQRWITFAMLCEIIVLIGLSLLLTPAFGLYGLVAAIVVSYAIEKIALVLILQLKYHLPITNYLAVRWYCFYSALLLFSVILTNVIY